MAEHPAPPIPEESLNLETEVEKQLSGLDLSKLRSEFKDFGFDYEFEDLRSEIAKVLPEFMQALERNLIVPIYARVLSTGNLAYFIQLKKSGAHENVQELLAKVDQIKLQILKTAKDSRPYRGTSQRDSSSVWIGVVTGTALGQLSVVDKLDLITYMRVLGFANLNQLLADWYTRDVWDNSEIQHVLTPHPPTTE